MKSKYTSLGEEGRQEASENEKAIKQAKCVRPKKNPFPKWNVRANDDDSKKPYPDVSSISEM